MIEPKELADRIAKQLDEKKHQMLRSSTFHRKRHLQITSSWRQVEATDRWVRLWK